MKCYTNTDTFANLLPFRNNSSVTQIYIIVTILYYLYMENIPNKDPEQPAAPEVDSHRKRHEVYNNWLYTKNTARMMSQDLHHHEYVDINQQINNPKAKPILQPIQKTETPSEEKYLEKVTDYSKIKIATSKLQAHLLDKMRSNPIFWDNPFNILNNNTLFIYISDAIDKKGLFNIIQKCAKMHDAVESAYNNYPEPAALYEHVFRRTPVGKIEIIKGPISLYFRCFDLHDYAWIHNQAFFNQNVNLTEDNLRDANKSGGCAIATAVPEDLKGVVIAENSTYINNDWESIRKHEEEHVIRRIIKNEWHPERSRKVQTHIGNNVREQIFNLRKIMPNNGFDSGYLDNIPEELSKQYLDFLFQQQRDTIYARGADEILAFFKDGAHTASETYFQLTMPNSDGGLYDYLESEYQDILTISENIEVKNLVTNVRDKEKEKYHIVLKIALEALRDLYGSGRFTRDEVIAFFDKEPLIKWTKVSKRLLIKTD